MTTIARLRRVALGSLVLAGLTCVCSTSAHAASLPSSADLSADAPPVGNQGNVTYAGAAWATDYYLRGWYAKRDGYYPSGPDSLGGYAPMYTYAQIAQGQDRTTDLEQNLDLQKTQGVDSRADYTQGDANVTSQPTAAERANAARAKIDSYETILPSNFFGPVSLQNYIETKLAGGDPVVIAIPIYPEFTSLRATSYSIPSCYCIGSPYPGEAAISDTVVAAFKYDATGVWIENSWGTGWGTNGWAELSWDFVNHYAYEVASIVPLSPLERFYNATTQTHWVTRNATAVASGYHYEGTLGLLLTGPQWGAVPLYGCLAAPGSNDHFVSLSSTCEGRVYLGLDGYLYSSAPLFVSTVQVYRCYRAVNGHGDHFVSTDAHCEGYTTEASLGYLRT